MLIFSTALISRAAVRAVSVSTDRSTLLKKWCAVSVKTFKELSVQETSSIPGDLSVQLV